MTEKPTFIFREEITSDEGYVQWMAEIKHTHNPIRHQQDMADIMVEKNIFGGTGCVRMHFDNHAGFRVIP